MPQDYLFIEAHVMQFFQFLVLFLVSNVSFEYYMSVLFICIYIKAITPSLVFGKRFFLLVAETCF